MIGEGREMCGALLAAGVSRHSLVGNRRAQNEVCGLLAGALLSLMDGRGGNLGRQP